MKAPGEAGSALDSRNGTATEPSSEGPEHTLPHAADDRSGTAGASTPAARAAGDIRTLAVDLTRDGAILHLPPGQVLEFSEGAALAFIPAALPPDVDRAIVETTVAQVHLEAAETALANAAGVAPTERPLGGRRSTVLFESGYDVEGSAKVILATAQRIADGAIAYRKDAVGGDRRSAARLHTRLVGEAAQLLTDLTSAMPLLYGVPALTTATPGAEVAGG